MSDERYQENLLTKCPVKLPTLTGTTGNKLAEVIMEYAPLYGTCAARHNQLVDEINQRKELTHERK
ncbi:hypothetical protein [Xenorhabdus szentirmaii]|uniref:hypothetical protein n=1 Tax=Xenorhabdus szentirmaii TaxID=290112 RepID=UPI000C0550EB|nr:hypothetical protein [Xenorhabdus szentirmaii]